MNVFNLFKENKSDNIKMSYAQTMTGRTPSYSSFGDNVMNDETVHTVTERIISEFSKLQPKHIRKVNGNLVSVSDNRINELLKFPNAIESISDFLSKAKFMLLDRQNVFIYPLYDLFINEKTGQQKKVYKEIKILNPNRVTFYEDTAGNYFVEFEFRNGKKSGYIDYNDVIHWRDNYGQNDFLGGNENGMPNNTALLKHCVLNDKLMQSTIKTIDGSLSINGILKIGGLLDEEKRETTRLKFEKMIKNSESGIVAVDTGAEYIQSAYNGQLIPKDTLEWMDSKIRRHYGVSQAILDGDYTAEQKEAFYETVLEPSIVSLGYAFERVMLTPFERANGNEIIFYSQKIMLMSHSKKIELGKLLQPTGGVTNNMILGWFGLPPYEGGDERFQSLNWVNQDIASQYQLELYKNGNKNIGNSYNNNDEKIKEYDESDDNEKEGNKNEE